MKATNSQVGIDHPAEDIQLHVLPAIRGGFGVFANAVLIAVHIDQEAANAHCQRLRHQQAED
jgi:hypothetical protein